MRIRIFCCYYDGEDNEKPLRRRTRKGTVIEMQTGPPLNEQPRRGESIQLEGINDLSAFHERVTEPSNVRDTSFIVPATRPSIPSILPRPTVSASSNFSYIGRDGKETKMTLDQNEPNCFQGTYKGSQFTIVNGQLQATSSAYTQADKDLILKNYSQAKLAMQQGILGIEARLIASLNRQVPPLNLRRLTQLSIPPGSKINVNFTADKGEKSKMTFKQVQLGLFRGTCNDKQFSIANGQVFPLDGADKGLNKELILSAFYRAMLGLQQTNLGLQHGEWAVETRLSGNQLNPMELLKAACPERRHLFETESLLVHNEFRKMHGVPPLTHSEFLCEMAREWAEHLALKDTSYKRPNNEYGENLYFSHGEPLNARKAVTAWYEEINLYDYSDPQFSKETGHFTQLVWKDTKEVGTGIAQLGDKVWVCYYHPPGNIESKFNEKHVPRPVEVADMGNSRA